MSARPAAASEDRPQRGHALAVLAVLALGACFAAALGFVSSDSWEYLHLAQALRDGQGCAVRGAYFATLPCGYPLAIALSAPAAGIGQLVIGSKFTNFLLLAGAYLLLAREQRNVLVPTLVIVNPATLVIYQYTWSENLFLFAACGALAALSRLARHARRSDVAWLALFLVVGCSARYVFGPLAALLFVGVWLIHGRRTARVALPAFVLAGMFFIAYQAVNVRLTGYASGMERVAAPETLAYLALRFANAFAHIAAYGAIALAVVLALSRRQWVLSAAWRDGDDETRRNLLLAWLGVGFLGLALALRATTHFDMYDTRTIGYGVAWLVAAAVGLGVRPAGGFAAPWAVCAGGALAMLLGHGGSLPGLMRDAFAAHYRSPLAALHDYGTPPVAADVVVVLATPAIAPTIAGDSRLYYAPPTRAEWVAAAPFRRAETLAQLGARLRATGARSCLIDYRPFTTRAALEADVTRSYVVDLAYAAGSGGFVETRRASVDASVADYLRGKFVAGSYVGCGELLAY